MSLFRKAARALAFAFVLTLALGAWAVLAAWDAVLGRDRGAAQ